MVEAHKRKPGLWCALTVTLETSGKAEPLRPHRPGAVRQGANEASISQHALHSEGWHLVAPFLVSLPLLSEAGAVSWLSSQSGLCMTNCQLQQEQALLTALSPPPPPKCISLRVPLLESCSCSAWEKLFLSGCQPCGETVKLLHLP